MFDLKGLGLSFQESMSGWVGIGQTDTSEGLVVGKRENTPCGFDVEIGIDDLSQFLNLTEHNASLKGTFTYEPFGGTFEITDGMFNLFSVDPAEGTRKMIYAFRFVAKDGKTYFFHGYKEIKDERGPFDVTHDMTTLFSKIYMGENDEAPVYAAGEIYFELSDAPSLVSSIKISGATWPWDKVAAFTAFMSFVFGTLRQEYLKNLNPLYDTEYENLVLNGFLMDGLHESKPFFFVSGVHDKDFPWGDGEIFWDVLLVVGDEDSGYQKYCITDRVLEGLKLNVGEGKYSYKGPIFLLSEGYATSFSEMRHKDPKLVQCEADFDIQFSAKPFPTTPLPFLKSENLVAQLSYELKNDLQNILPSEHLLGIFITPYEVTVNSGRLRISGSPSTLDSSIVADKSFGEAESSTLRNFKEPTMLYGYICALQPEKRFARVQIHASTLRNEREDWVKDRIDAFLGAIISRMVSLDIQISNDEIKVNKMTEEDSPEIGVPCFLKVNNPILEVSNDHFPSAVFQRRIIKVKDPSGANCLALEEAMNMMRLEGINSDKTCVVASVRDDDKYKALESVLDATKFWDFLEAKQVRSGKSPDQFLIAIKPNFMFAYNKADHSTYTDPDLVGRLVSLLTSAKRGYKNLAIVEAQSTYGEYFDRRSVHEVAEYLGYDISGNSGYRVVDLTKEPVSSEHLGPHLGEHPISPTWTNADFRISFAKNKTHAYATYSLTVKNIYGALPMANKFKEYHCDRDIYYTTIEFLKAFPVDFGIIDAFLSADGPFGVFADPTPNPTNTIIGGADLVAVDWVGSTKMGIDPMISKYMRLAVDAFGKPEIQLIGDSNLYYPWLNVPPAVTLFARGMDLNHYFGNLIYMTGSYMDDSYFTYKNRDQFMTTLREAIKPLQEMIFLQPGGKISAGAKALSRIFTALGD